MDILAQTNKNLIFHHNNNRQVSKSREKKQQNTKSSKMALTMAEKSVTSSLFKRLPFNLLQTFKLSTALNPNSSPPSTTTTSESSTTEKRKKKKGKNLFEVAKFLPDWGIGCHFAKKHWTDVSYEVTKINLYKSGNHGKAWGLAYVNGRPVAAPKKISGVHKRCWKYIKNPPKLKAPKPDESIPDPLKLEAPKPDESIPDPLKLDAPKPDAAQVA